MPVPTTVRPRRIDPRLLRRTRGSRRALAVDAALGIVAALLVLAQAVLIAHIAARSFDGAGPRALSLPLAALCAVVPAAVLVLVAAIDPLSALLMLVTLPLVPVFMWLIGRTTERRALARWQELSLLSSHFLDVVRGLPTLRAFNRGEAQAERIDQ